MKLLRPAPHSPGFTAPVIKPRPSVFLRSLSLPFNPWWLLWVIAISAAWLLPTHLLPWRGFHADLAMVLALLPAAVWIVARSGRPIPLHVSAVAALLSACVPPLQYAAGIIYFSGDAWISSAYLFAWAVALLVGARFQQLIPGSLVKALFGAIGVAALLSTGLVLNQWLRVLDLGLLAIYMPVGMQPFANLGQPNHVATLLVWGLIALWWAYLKKTINGKIAAAAAALVIVGIVATQSRTAWLEIALLGIGAFIYRGPLETRRYAPCLGALVAFFAVAAVNWPAINQAIHFEAARTLSDEMSPGLRPAAWKLFIDALGTRPWTGWGWNQLSVAQAAVALDHPSLRYTFQSSHNLVLDLLVQNGVVLGTFMALGIAAWLISTAIRIRSADSCVMLLAIAVLLVHALLEFPQTYAYFLLPAGLMMGALDESSKPRQAMRMPRWFAAAMLCVAAILTSWIAVEYNLAERSLERVRFERKRVGPSRDSKAPELLMLTQLREFMWFLRVKPESSITPAQLDTMRAVLARYPSDGNHLVFAIAAAYNGYPEEAQEALARMCRMVPRDRCVAALENWRHMAASTATLAGIALPEIAWSTASSGATMRLPSHK